jgi:hypothetical protein
VNGSLATAYVRSAALVLLLLAGAVFALSGARESAWAALLPLFEWMETTWFGVIGKTWGAAFAVVEAFHLLAMAVLGGAVLVSDARLLGLVFSDQPARQVFDACHRLFVAALVLVVFTGVFMACGVALKIYYLPVYWYKMLALGVGIAFVFLIRRPLLRREYDSIRPSVRRAVAVASIMIWFTVAATGRWIGFSG